MLLDTDVQYNTMVLLILMKNIKLDKLLNPPSWFFSKYSKVKDNQIHSNQKICASEVMNVTSGLTTMSSL